MQYITRIPNDANAPQLIRELKVAAKMVGCSVRIYGRCHDRKKAFQATGRRWSKNANKNDICLSSKQAPFCYEWVAYRRSR